MVICKNSVIKPILNAGNQLCCTLMKWADEKQLAIAPQKSSLTLFTKDTQPVPAPALRGPTPFEDMIFYLWTDSNEICTAYVKLNSKHILFMRIFSFSI